MIIVTKKPPRQCTAADLSALEKEIGSSIPRDYADFLLATNGGYCGMGDDEVSSLFDFVIPPYNRSELGILAVMYSLGIGPKNGIWDDLGIMNRKMRGSGMPLPKEMIPIGETDGFWILTLGVSGRFRDGVYILMASHAQEWGDVLVAKSFRDFNEMVRQEVAPA